MSYEIINNLNAILFVVQGTFQLPKYVAVIAEQILLLRFIYGTFLGRRVHTSAQAAIEVVKESSNLGITMSTFHVISG